MPCPLGGRSAVANQDADDPLQVKGNQSNLIESVVDEFDRHVEDNDSHRRVRRLTLTEKNRGRLETRTCVVAPAPSTLKSKQAGLRTIGLIHRTRQLADRTIQEQQSDVISSLET